MKRVRLFFPLLLSLLTVVAYANSFSGVFLFDDVIRIVEEERIRRLWPIGPLLGGERPVVDLTLAVNYALGELNPWGYHAFNLAVHILAGLALFGIVRRTIFMIGARSSPIEDAAYHPIANRKPQIDNSWDSLIAFAVALIFLIHPLQTQSVTYVIQRGESMMGLFYLVTLYCALRAIDSPRPWMWQGGAVLACALGMGTKAVMVTAPLIIVLYDWVFLSRGAIQTRFYEQRKRVPFYIGLCSTWIVLWLCGIGPEVLGKTQGTSHVGFSYQGISALQYAATQPGVILKYLQLALWPANLCLDYDWPVASGWQQIVLPSMIVGVAVVMTIWLLYRRHWLGFVGAWFFLILAPTSSLVPIKDLMFEHRMYLPLAAVIAAIVVPFGSWFTGSIGHRQTTTGHPVANRQSTINNFTFILVASIAFLAAPLAYATHIRNRAYHNELTMWKDVIAKRPNNARGYIGVGNALAFSGDLGQGLEIARESTLVNPNYADGYFGTGNILSRLGRTEEAIKSYQEAIDREPSHSRAWYNLGNAFDRLGRYDEAVRAYARSVEFNGHFADAYCNFGNTLMRQNKTEDAIEKYRQALAIEPRHVRCHNNLGDALAKLGEYEKAQKEFEEAILIQPDYHKARINLALLHKRRGRFDEALGQCEIVLQNEPTHQAAKDLKHVIQSAIGK